MQATWRHIQKKEAKQKTKQSMMNLPDKRNGIYDLCNFSQFLSSEVMRVLDQSRHGKKQEIQFHKSFESVQTFISQAIEIAKEQAKSSHIQIDHKWQKMIVNNDSRFFFDKNRLKLVLSKILSNAIKHSPEYSTVSVRTNLEKHENNTELWPCWNLVVTVIDNGPGFVEEQQRQFMSKQIRLFKLNPCDSLGPNSFFGLSFCKMVSESHSGDLAIKSVPRRGAQIVMRFSIIMDTASPI